MFQFNTREIKEYDEELKVELRKYSLEELREMLTESMSRAYAYWFVHHEILSNHEYKIKKGDKVLAHEDEEHLNQLVNIASSYINDFVDDVCEDLHICFSMKYRPSVTINVIDPTDFSNKECLTICVIDWNYPYFTEDNTRDMLRYFLLLEKSLMKEN